MKYFKLMLLVVLCLVNVGCYTKYLTGLGREACRARLLSMGYERGEKREFKIVSGLKARGWLREKKEGLDVGDGLKKELLLGGNEGVFVAEGFEILAGGEVASDEGAGFSGVKIHERDAEVEVYEGEIEVLDLGDDNGGLDLGLAGAHPFRETVVSFKREGRFDVYFYTFTQDMSGAMLPTGSAKVYVSEGHGGDREVFVRVENFLGYRVAGGFEALVVKQLGARRKGFWE